jgi:hypothetical protein
VVRPIPITRGDCLNRKVKILLAAAIILFFFIALLICIDKFGEGSSNSSDLTVYSSFLASMLSLIVLVYACLIYKEDNAPSEQYRKKYMDEKEKDDEEEKPH